MTFNIVELNIYLFNSCLIFSRLFFQNYNINSNERKSEFMMSINDIIEHNFSLLFEIFEHFFFDEFL